MDRLTVGDREPHYPCKLCGSLMTYRLDEPGYWLHTDTGIRQCGDDVRVGEPVIPSRLAGPRSRRLWDLSDDADGKGVQ